MMGTKTLTVIRAELRQSLDMSDAQLLAWFNDQLRGLERRPKANKTELDTLTLLRDGLLQDTKAGPRKPAKRRVTARPKR